MSIYEINNYLQKLFDLPRSITGEGNRKTLNFLQEIIPLEIFEVPSGKKVFDWTIPPEWSVKEAWIESEDGHRFVDYENSNLHLVGYSSNVSDILLSWKDLKPHLYYHSKIENAIPYRTSYYADNWGFCVDHTTYNQIKQNKSLFRVRIDAEKKQGSLTYGEYFIKGSLSKEILISCYICHPSMANDSLSGILTTAFLARELSKRKDLQHSYRFVFVPETIGAIAYCAINTEIVKNIKRGLVITTCGGPGDFGYKQSWDNNDSINMMMEDVFNDKKISFITYPFDVLGSDERQYSSIGFRINCITLTKDKYYEYDYYHTSLDDLSFVSAESINQSIELYTHLIDILDCDLIFRSLEPNCEIMLSKHNLYPKVGGALSPQTSGKSLIEVRMWLLFLCDGSQGLYEISKKTGINVKSLLNHALELQNKKLLEVVKK
jgi:aminopeptidase-like protein